MDFPGPRIRTRATRLSARSFSPGCQAGDGTCLLVLQRHCPFGYGAVQELPPPAPLPNIDNQKWLLWHSGLRIQCCHCTAQVTVVWEPSLIWEGSCVKGTAKKKKSSLQTLPDVPYRWPRTPGFLALTRIRGHNGRPSPVLLSKVTRNTISSQLVCFKTIKCISLPIHQVQEGASWEILTFDHHFHVPKLPPPPTPFPNCKPTIC